MSFENIFEILRKAEEFSEKATLLEKKKVELLWEISQKLEKIIKLLEGK